MRALFTILLIAYPLWTAADTLVLAGGDTLSGELLDIESDTIAFKTAYAGRTFVPLDEAQSLSTNGWYDVTLQGGITLTARLEVRQGKQCLITNADTPTPVALKDILHARPAASAPEDPTAPDTGDLQVATGIGALRRWANLSQTSAFTWLDLDKETSQYRFESRFRLAGAEADTFPDWLTLDTSWRFRPQEEWGPRLQIGLQRDTDSGMGGRIEAGLGVETDLINAPDTRLTLGGGLTASHAYYNSDLLYRAGHRVADPVATILERGGAANLEEGVRALFDTRYYDNRRKYTETNAELFLDLRYERSLLNNRATLIENFRIAPGLTQWGDLIAQSESIMHVPVTRSLSMRLQLNLDYDNDPPFRNLNTFRSAIGAGFEFGF